MKHKLTKAQSRAPVIGKKAEKVAKKWLEDKSFRVAYWHKGKASSKPYDIICYKNKNGYAIDVKTGKNPGISLKNFNTLLNKSVRKIKLETHCKNLKRINKIGYIFVIKNQCYLLEYNKRKYIARVAVSRRKKTK